MRSPLLPNRHPSADFFVSNVLDAVAKANMTSMKHTIFSLSTRPDTRLRRYELWPNFVEVTLSVKGSAIVHDRDFFRLRKPPGRRMYELARKHCGYEEQWAIGLAKRRDKCGSGSSMKKFRRMVRAVCDEDAAHGHIPDHSITMDVAVDGGDKVVFRNRRTMAPHARTALDDDPIPLARLRPRGRALGRARLGRLCLGTRMAGLVCRQGGAVARPGTALVRFCRPWAQRRSEA